MDLLAIQAELSRGPQRVAALVGDLDRRAASWRAQPERWAPVEVVCHLRDEEREDFPVRLRHLLEGRPGAWPPIDPAGWAVSRQYLRDDLATALAAFATARQQALAWLASVARPDWTRVYEAPWGPLTAADLLGSWVAHDNLHLRQLVRWQRARLEALTTGCALLYAGEW